MRKNFAKIPCGFLRLEKDDPKDKRMDNLLRMNYAYTMNNDTNKKACARCSKQDCAQCVEEDGKSFCCQVCREEYGKEKAEQKKDEAANVCRFC